MNESILMFEQQLYNLINNCGLPIGVAYCVVKNASLELKLATYEYEKEPESQKTDQIDIPVEEEEEKEIEENE